MSSILPDLAITEKRVVLRHPNGLHQILGVSLEQPPSFLELQRATVDGLSLPINLVAAKPRYYLFTIVQPPATIGGTLHEQQR